MTFEDYKRQVEWDAREAIKEGAGWYESWDEMYDALFTDDAVTGNGSGSYTFSTARAAENARGLVFETGSSLRHAPRATVWSCSPRGRRPWTW